MISIPAHIWDDMISHARSLDPHECCGVLAGKDGEISEQYRITNILATMSEEELATFFEKGKLSDLKNLSPEQRADIAFIMDMGDFSAAVKDIRQKEFTLPIFYHSHTSSPARPSDTDIQKAMDFEDMRDKLNFPEPLHLIISLEDKANPVLRAYRIQNSLSSEVAIQKK
ncbi:M67 family metallopeptidase [Candidatus Nitronereus thalassa]|uniref:M67 family metallopeptidase n=1 Tax=Candidatus Nitronereus thalassa TaxID=3020898 RepID=A0ABU3K4X8_9BACT|nr:M67 family metallopeptidase [Candidatus Nitronereus thalassa]MDT7041457.1 M67 family metallopeptidase [Candidatus Nitronereus thalassa]